MSTKLVLEKLLLPLLLISCSSLLFIMSQVEYGYSREFTTYTNEEFGINFKYPIEWEIDEYPAFNEHEININNEDGTESVSINIYKVDNPFSKYQKEIGSAIDIIEEYGYTYEKEISSFIANNPTTSIKYENSEDGIIGLNYYGYDDYRAYNLSFKVDSDIYKHSLTQIAPIALSFRLSDISSDLIPSLKDENDFESDENENCQRPPPQPCTRICAPLFSGGQHCWYSCPPSASPDC